MTDALRPSWSDLRTIRPLGRDRRGQSDGGGGTPCEGEKRRGYKWEAHERWEATLGRDVHRDLIAAGNFAVVAGLPRRQTRVLTWPLVTVFGFLALPDVHFFLKPMVTRAAAREYGFDFRYQSRPIWDTYSQLLDFARFIRGDLRNMKPRDMIDIQSFLWVQGSDEYEE